MVCSSNEQCRCTWRVHPLFTLFEVSTCSRIAGEKATVTLRCLPKHVGCVPPSIFLCFLNFKAALREIPTKNILIFSKLYVYCLILFSLGVFFKGGSKEVNRLFGLCTRFQLTSSFSLRRDLEVWPAKRNA